MNLRRIAKPVCAVLLTVGLLTVGVAPADVSTPQAKSQTRDTGWG